MEDKSFLTFPIHRQEIFLFCRKLNNIYIGILSYNTKIIFVQLFDW